MCNEVETINVRIEKRGDQWFVIPEMTPDAWQTFVDEGCTAGLVVVLPDDAWEVQTLLDLVDPPLLGRLHTVATDDYIQLVLDNMPDWEDDYEDV